MFHAIVIMEGTKMANKGIGVNLRLEQGLYNKVKAIADDESMSVSKVCRQIIAGYFDQRADVKSPLNETTYDSLIYRTLADKKMMDAFNNIEIDKMKYQSMVMESKAKYLELYSKLSPEEREVVLKSMG